MLMHHPELNDINWQPAETAPLDGTRVWIRGKAFSNNPGYFLSAKARYLPTEVRGGYLLSWVTEDGKFAWHCYAWHPC